MGRYAHSYLIKREYGSISTVVIGRIVMKINPQTATSRTCGIQYVGSFRIDKGIVREIKSYIGKIIGILMLRGITGKY